MATLIFADFLVSELVFGQRSYEVIWRTDARAGSLLGSAAIYFWLCKHDLSPTLRRRLGWLPLAALLAGLFCFSNRVPEPVAYSIGSILLAVSVNTLEWAPGWLLEQLSTPSLRYMARISFSLYIWQEPFYALSQLRKLSNSLTVAMVPGVFLVGTASFYLIEQPCRSALTQMKPRRRMSLTPEAALLKGSPERNGEMAA